MIDLYQAENTLKNVYLGIIRDQLNNKSDPVLAKIKNTQENVWGNKIIVSRHFEDTYYTIEEELVTFTATIEITDKAIRCSQNSTGAFVNLLNDTIETMLVDTKRRLANSFYNEDTKPTYLPEDYKFEPMKVNGLKKLFDTKNNITKLNPYIDKINKFDTIKIQEIIDNNNDEVNMMLCSPKTKMDYVEYVSECRRYIDIADLGGGYKGIYFNENILIHTNKSIPDNEIYLINTDDFKLHQLCDWEWLEDGNGRILKQDINKPVYRATLVKYANYVCSNPSGQIKIVIEE